MVFWEHYHGGAFTFHCLIGLWLEWQYKLYFECQILMLHKDQVCKKPACTHIGRNWKLQHYSHVAKVFTAVKIQCASAHHLSKCHPHLCSLLHVNIL